MSSEPLLFLTLTLRLILSVNQSGPLTATKLDGSTPGTPRSDKMSDTRWRQTEQSGVKKYRNGSPGAMRDLRREFELGSGPLIRANPR